MARYGKLLFHAILSSIFLLSLISLVVKWGGITFYLELAGLLFLMLITFIAFLGFTDEFGERLFQMVYALSFFNFVLIWLVKDDIYVVLVLLAIAGFLLSFPPCSKKQDIYEDDSEPYSVVYDAPQQDTPTVAKTPKAVHSPGKYVASKKGKYYHEPKSEWAKKIKKENQVWFKNRQDAWEQGYRAHKDVPSE